MRLYLVQHGEAVPESEDPARPLSPHGHADVTRLAAFLAARGPRAERVCHSGKLRARQTAEILAGALAPGALLEEIPGIAPMDPVEDFAATLAAWDGDSLVVGHLPFMAHCVAFLTAGDAAAGIVAYEPGTLVCLERDAGAWSIAWMLRPSLLGKD